MLYPFNMPQDDYRIIAKASTNLSKTYLNGYDDEKSLPSNFVEPEIVWYPKTNCLCIQGHPEYMDKKSEAVRFINVLVEELLDGHEDKIPEKKIQRVNAVNNNRLAEAIQNAHQVLNNRRPERLVIDWEDDALFWENRPENFGIVNAANNNIANELEDLV